MTEKLSVWQDLKLRTSTLTLAGLLMALVACNYGFSTDLRDFAVRVTLMVFGACIGWVLGVFASPYSEAEAGRFSAFAKVAGTFASGYLLGKADGLFTHILSPSFLVNMDSGLRLVSVGSAVVIFFLFTFIFRNYAPNTRLPTNITDHTAI